MSRVNVAPFAWAGWRLRLPGGPAGGQYHGLLGLAEADAPDGIYRGPAEVRPERRANTIRAPYRRKYGGMGMVMAPVDGGDGGGGGGGYTYIPPVPTPVPYIPPVVAVPTPAQPSPAPVPYIPPVVAVQPSPAPPGPYNYIPPSVAPDPVLPNDPVIVYTPDGAVTVPAWTVGLATAPAPAPVSDNIIGGGSGYMPMPTPELYQWTPMPVPVPPMINAPIAMDGSGATSVVAQPAPVDSPAPNQNVVNVVPYGVSVSPAPAPTVAASPSDFLPSQGLPLPQSSGVQVVVNSDGTYSVVAGNQSATSQLTTWLQAQTLITGYPNWEVGLGALALLWFLKRGRK